MQSWLPSMAIQRCRVGSNQIRADRPVTPVGSRNRSAYEIRTAPAPVRSLMWAMPSSLRTWWSGPTAIIGDGVDASRVSAPPEPSAGVGVPLVVAWVVDAAAMSGPSSAVGSPTIAPSNSPSAADTDRPTSSTITRPRRVPSRGVALRSTVGASAPGASVVALRPRTGPLATLPTRRTRLPKRATARSGGGAGHRTSLRQRPRCSSASWRAISRLASRSAMSRRRSWSCLPRARPSSSLALPRLR